MDTSLTLSMTMQNKYSVTLGMTKGEINQQDKSVWQFYKYDKDFASKTKFKGLVWIFLNLNSLFYLWQASFERA